MSNTFSRFGGPGNRQFGRPGSPWCRRPACSIPHASRLCHSIFNVRLEQYVYYCIRLIWRFPGAFSGRIPRQWGVGSGEWEVGSGKWEVGSGEWRVESGEWRVGSGEWGVGGSDDFPRSALPFGETRSENRRGYAATGGLWRPLPGGRMFAWPAERSTVTAVSRTPTRQQVSSSPLFLL